MNHCYFQYDFLINLINFIHVIYKVNRFIKCGSSQNKS